MTNAMGIQKRLLKPAKSRLGSNSHVDDMSNALKIHHGEQMESSVMQEEKAYWISQRTSACMWSCLMSFFGVILGITENEVLWQGTMTMSDVTVYLIILKSIIILSTIVTISFLLRYYEAIINVRRMSGVLLTPGISISGLRGAGLLKQLIWDIILLLPMPIPFVDADVTMWDQGLGRESIYGLDSLLVCSMFVRFSLVPRFYAEVFSDLSSETAVAIGRLNQLTVDSSFIMKYVIANSLQVVTVLFAIQVFMFSYLMMCAERPTEGGALHNYGNCVWLVVITMTTVGYGDEYPTTMCGRVVSVGASITAVVMLGIVINLVVSKLSLSRQESKVIEVMDKIQLRKDLKTAAAVVVQRWYRGYRDAMIKSKGPSRNKASKGYLRIPDYKPDYSQPTYDRGNSKGKISLEVLSTTSLLISINYFSELRRQTFANQLQIDLTEMVGNLTSKLHIQEKRIQMMHEKTVRLNELIDRLAGA